MKIGKLSESVLNRSILKPIKQNGHLMQGGAVVGDDCALFASLPDSLMAVDVQEGAVSIAGGNRGIPVRNLIIKACNNLATGGASPVGLELCFLLPEDITEQEIKLLSAQAGACAKELDVPVTGGQTCVSTQVKSPMAVVTAVGMAFASGRSRKVEPGMEIVLSKWIGLEGTALLAAAYKEKLLKRYPSYMIEEAENFQTYLSLIPEAATAVKSGVCRMHDASKGGVMGALWELCQSAGVGLNIDFKKLPIRQETVEICEELGVNPYKLLSGGCLLMITDNAAELISALKDEGIPAVSIGTVTDGKSRVLHNEEELRYLEKPEQDEIYRFFDL